MLHTAPHAHGRGIRIGAVAIIAIGALALTGWLTGSRTLSSAGANFIPMAPNTAVLFMLLGFGLWALTVASRATRRAAIAAIAISLVVAGTRLVEYMGGPDLRVDSWLFSFPTETLGLAPIGKMAFFTALSFVLACLALAAEFFPRLRRDLTDLARALSVLVTLIGLVFSLGYLYAAPLLYGGRSIPMALPTAIAFVVLGLSIVVPASLRDRADRLEQARSRAHIDGAFEHAAIGMALVAPDGRWLRVNRALCRIMGYSEEELLATTIQALTHPDDLATDLEHTNRVLGGESRNYEVEKRFITRSGAITWALVAVSLVRDAEGTPLYFVSQLQVITERKRAEAELTRQALLFATITDGVAIMDTTGSVTDWNPAAERIFGYTKEDMLGRDMARLQHPDVGGAIEREVRSTLARDGRWYGEMPFLRRDGAQGVVDVAVLEQRDATGAPAAWVSVNRDVTERERTAAALRASEAQLRKSEEQLRQAQKMEAVGQLAGGVAHDFNNILTAITSYSSLVMEELDPSDPNAADVAEIKKAADRAAALTRQLLAFSRRQMLQPQVLDLNHTVSELEKMLKRLLVADIQFVTVLEPKLGSVTADPGQIEQVVMNLVVNARDAMPDGGTLTVETSNVELKEPFPGSATATSIPSGAYVRIAVTDTGCGMDEATQERIFEPFFTTKEVGKGTGLGLSTVYGIVKQSGGYIWCYSEVGKGTTFKVYLPRVAAAATQIESTTTSVGTRRGTETVLLVEDDDAVRSVARRILTRQGYTVLEARNGSEALLLCDEAKGSIGIIVTDMVMPEMSGPELGRRVQSLHPEIRLLFMSGYTRDAALRQSFLEPGAAFIEKPFEPAALAKRVGEVLDAPHREALVSAS